MSEGFRFPWESPSAPGVPPTAADDPLAKSKPRGRRPASVSLAATGVAPAWLYHHLTISGPAEPLAAVAVAARGSGVTPWRLDGAEVEETVFNLAVAQPARDRGLTVEGCRILARQFRERVVAHQARAAARVGHSVACPFDLHALLPVPATVLQLGPMHPVALDWLQTHWGITDQLRQVIRRPNATTGRRLPKHHAVIGYGFFTNGETPHAAAAQLAPQWPALRFALVPRPAD